MDKIVYPAGSRGQTDLGWLDSKHSFSFGDYHDPGRMGFGALRVLNDDLVSPGKGFPPHAHQNMEIISIVLSGSLRHEDSTGNIQVIAPGEVQIMSAGTGIRHSEFNASKSEPVSFLQIWVIPEKHGTRPRYDQQQFSLPDPESGEPRLLISPDGQEGSVLIGQQCDVSRASLPAGKKHVHQIRIPGNGLFLFVLSGTLSVAGEQLGKRDAIGLTRLTSVEIEAPDKATVLMLEVPPC